MILTILKKDLKVYFLDKRGVFLTFLLPIILITLFAFAFGGVGKSKRVQKPTKILVVDNDASKTSSNVISKLNTLKVITLIPSKEEESIELVKKGKNVAVLIIGEGFSNALAFGKQLPIELKYDAAREIEMRMLQSVLKEGLNYSIGNTGVENKIDAYLNKNFSGLDTNTKSKIAYDLSAENNLVHSKKDIRLKLTSVIKEANTKTNAGLIQAVSGTAIMMLLFSIAAIGSGLLDEKEAGTLKRLLYSPIKPVDILLGKMGAALVISVLQLTAMFIFSWIAFGLPIFIDIISLLLLILCISFAVSSFGILLVSTVKTRQQLQGMSTIIILLMSAIGGSMIPISMLPDFMQKVAVISVNYWGIQGFYDVFWRHLPLLDIIPKMLILLSIGTAMTLLSIKLFKKNILRLE